MPPEEVVRVRHSSPHNPKDNRTAFSDPPMILGNTAATTSNTHSTLDPLTLDSAKILAPKEKSNLQFPPQVAGSNDQPQPEI